MTEISRHATEVAALSQLIAFLADSPLTTTIATLEREMQGAGGTSAAAAASATGLNEPLLDAAMLLRKRIGRLNDVIHAAAICMSLPTILDPDERIAGRPSLAAGNDASRPFDLETDRRIVEFKLAVWSGADAMRKRGLFHDFVHLAAATTDVPIRQLYVVGERPEKFLRTSRSTADWALTRGSETTRAVFREKFGSLDMTIRDFTAGPGHNVEIRDLTECLPQLRILEGNYR